MRQAWVLLVGASWLSIASCGGGGETITRGEFCDSVLTTFCNRVVACQIATFDACFEVNKLGCCLNDDSCGDILNTTPAMTLETNCNTAISTEACDEVASSTLPAACLMTP